MSAHVSLDLEINEEVLTSSIYDSNRWSGINLIIVTLKIWRAW